MYEMHPQRVKCNTTFLQFAITFSFTKTPKLLGKEIDKAYSTRDYPMAEAVVGLSLAANILQMVEYGATFVKTAFKIYSSKEGVYSINDFQRLSCLSQDLDSLETRSLRLSAYHSEVQDDSGLIALVIECRKVVQKILPCLQAIGRSGEGKIFTKNKAIKAAFKLAWNIKEIKELHVTLEGMRGQLTLHLVTSMRWVTISISCVSAKAY